MLTGRHRGIELAKSEVLCFLDDDVWLNENYTVSLNKIFENSEVHFATGPCIPKFYTEEPNWLQYFWEDVPEGKFCFWLSLLDLGNEAKWVSPVYVFGLNFSCRKSVVMDLGGFHPDCIPKSLQHFQGDGESGLSFKAITKGLRALYTPGLALYHDVTEERLTPEYFKTRAFYEGVCKSFTDIRKQHFGRQPSKTLQLLKKYKSLAHYYYRRLFSIHSDKINNTDIPEEIVQMMQTFKQEERQGYYFHQQAFKNNPKVREWVLKENYWDYRLPE